MVNDVDTNARRSDDRPAFLLLTTLWVALVVLVDPRGNFPLIDDWSFGRAVKILVEQSRLEYDGWNAPTLFMQVLYGALFCLPFGFSFEALRISVVVAGLAGGLATYAFLRQASGTKMTAAFGALVFMLNPVYFQYSFTFMTDVPFAALAVMSGVFYLRALRTGSGRDAAVGTILACTATLIRQIGLAIPTGYALTLLITQGLQKRTITRAALCFMATWLVLQGYNKLIDALHLTPALSGSMNDLIFARLATYGWFGMLGEGLKIGVWLFTFCALFVLPFVLGRIVRTTLLEHIPRQLKLSFAIACSIFFLMALSRNLPPYEPLRIFGVAPMGILGERGWGAVDEPAFLRQILSVLAVAAAAWFLFIIACITSRYAKYGWFGGPSEKAGLWFGTTTLLVMASPVLLVGFQERYVIPLVPFALVALTAACGGLNLRTCTRQMIAGAIAFSAFGTLAVLYAHDFLAWNRTRWDAVNFLIYDNAIDPARIDGGLSVNGWYLFQRDDRLRTAFINWQTNQTSTAFWRNTTAEYLICLERCGEPGVWNQIWVQEYRSWLPGADGSIVIFRR